MLILTITICCALAAGLVVAHGLNQAKAATEPIFHAYQRRLEKTRKRLAQTESDVAGDRQRATTRRRRSAASSTPE